MIKQVIAAIRVLLSRLGCVPMCIVIGMQLGDG